jgi:hypothetical protein
MGSCKTSAASPTRAPTRSVTQSRRPPPPRSRDAADVSVHPRRERHDSRGAHLSRASRTLAAARAERDLAGRSLRRVPEKQRRARRSPPPSGQRTSSTPRGRTVGKRPRVMPRDRWTVAVYSGQRSAAKSDRPVEAQQAEVPGPMRARTDLVVTVGDVLLFV